MQETLETQVWYLDQEDPLEEKMATHSSSLWRTGKPDMLQSMGSQWVRHDWSTEQQPVFLPGKPHGKVILAGYSQWGRQELDRAERLQMHA